MPSHYARAVIYVNEVSQSEAITSTVQVMEDVFGGSGEKLLGPSVQSPDYDLSFPLGTVATTSLQRGQKKKKKKPLIQHFPVQSLYAHNHHHLEP
jgi:hypothetical protein